MGFIELIKGSGPGKVSRSFEESFQEFCFWIFDRVHAQTELIKGSGPGTVSRSFEEFRF